jgi:hypothetical protein
MRRAHEKVCHTGPRARLFAQRALAESFSLEQLEELLDEFSQNTLEPVCGEKPEGI